MLLVTPFWFCYTDNKKLEEYYVKLEYSSTNFDLRRAIKMMDVAVPANVKSLTLDQIKLTLFFK